ncbi:unnamed protein product [Didymodactylos carnosus]|uniref:Uncharacterized protein n=1 Tax=Didymodactylos carnosus TaxID=1234261 RepID=A0A8S2E0A3_9BILA|nr:unnamed protein product [Didymodactylos carnosus]CAF3807842.1 unnamed protein product [Didymodactylos carnosus]
MMKKHINEFRTLITCERPNPKDPDYAAKSALYLELVKGGTLMMEHLRKTITDLLTRYRLFLEELWEAISADKDPTPVTRKFEQHVDNYMQQRWDPLFDKFDRLSMSVEGKPTKPTDT